MNGTLTKENSFVKSRAKLFASKSEDDALDGSPEKKTPSYVSLSCTVSGYSGINRYDSRARQEISRSRDSSRDGRLPLCMAKSRDSSPSKMRQAVPPGGFNLSDIPVVNSSPQQLNGRSKSVDRGYLRQNFLNGFANKPPSGPSTLQAANEERGRGRIRSSTVPHQSGDSKSVIQQRIERLYGPAALAGGFFLVKSPARSVKEPLKSVNNNNNTITTSKDVPDGCQTPPVFRHLNAEFRQQLQVKNKRSPSAALSPSPSPVKEIPPSSPQIAVVQESPKTNGTVQQLDDGHKFLKIMDDEKKRIECLIAKNELYLMDSKVETSDELTGKIRAATGKAKLLLAQKFEQFAGLCHKNLTQSPDEPFPTTGQDLAGFWDMVMIQVDHVKSMFAEIQKLKENNWVEVQETPEEKTNANRSGKSRTRPPQQTAARSAKAEEAAKAREEARKKMLQDRKRMAKAKKEEDWVIAEVVEKPELVAANGAIEGEPVPV